MVGPSWQRRAKVTQQCVHLLCLTPAGWLSAVGTVAGAPADIDSAVRALAREDASKAARRGGMWPAKRHDEQDQHEQGNDDDDFHVRTPIATSS
jgi:hypothetical protein